MPVVRPASRLNCPRAFPGLERPLPRHERQADALKLQHDADLLAEGKSTLFVVVAGLAAAERGK
jgi:hypothetical protein